MVTSPTTAPSPLSSTVVEWHPSSSLCVSQFSLSQIGPKKSLLCLISLYVDEQIKIQIPKLELADQVPCEKRDPRAASDVHLSLKSRESFTHLSLNLLTEPFSLFDNYICVIWRNLIWILINAWKLFLHHLWKLTVPEIFIQWRSR